MIQHKILVTGGAGFIGFHVCRRLLEDGWEVVSLDSLTDYYDVGLKEARLAILKERDRFHFHKLDLADAPALRKMFAEEAINAEVPIIHLAAQPGVRYSQVNPGSYIQSNLVGFFNLLEAARTAATPHLIYASSSSVYGGNRKLPYSEHDPVDHPVSLYAATKRSNELLAHVYAHTYGLPATGLRFFTVYGPWGRPDMSYFIFTHAILNHEPIQVFNHGDMSRDFTYIDDIVEGVCRLINLPPQPADSNAEHINSPATSWNPHRIYNIGNHKSVPVLDFLKVIEDAVGRKAQVELKPMQTGDVKATFADVKDLFSAVGFKPQTTIEEGIPKFVKWYRDYYRG